MRVLRRLGVFILGFGAAAVLGGSLSHMRGLQSRVAALEEQSAQDRAALQQLRSEAQELRQIAGFTSASGPGVIVTLRDSPRRLAGLGGDGIIHDHDINAVVNELVAAGAEAVAVAGADTSRLVRIGALTSARCAGPGMQIDTAILGGPYHVHAIGDPAALEARLRLPNGVLAKTGLELLGMYTLERRESVTVPARAERPTFRLIQWGEVAVQPGG